jgi:hypothetical protein
MPGKVRRLFVEGGSNATSRGELTAFCRYIGHVA